MSGEFEQTARNCGNANATFSVVMVKSYIRVCVSTVAGCLLKLANESKELSHTACSALVTALSTHWRKTVLDAHPSTCFGRKHAL